MPEQATSVVPVTPIAVTGTTQREKIKCITDKLEEGVRAIFASDEYREYLDFLSKFHDYSYNNVILMATNGA